MRAKNQTGGVPGGQGRGEVWMVSWLAVAILASVWGARAGGAEGVGLDEEAAFQAAAAAVAPAVVRVEVAGVSEAGLGGPAEASPASGPSSGLVVGADGWVVATSFAVPKDATQAVVTLPGGARLVARVTGRDLARGLVLLKVDLPAGAPPLPVMEAVPRESLAVGQWTLVLGRAWSAKDPSVGIGILSATNRAWGRAVQTDASVSPANYGGPLVDIEGRVIGVLAPLPAETAGMMVGTELYDSGIGFAVPLEDILRVLPRLQAGETLSPGIIGIGYASRDPFTAPPVVATCRPDSPAGRAGLRVGDRIVAAGGRAVSRVAELKHVIAPLYAGDLLDLVVERGEARERLPMRVELVATLPPWRRPVLGLVPRRAGGGDAAVAGAALPQNVAAERGVSVAWVWPDGPAARAGITTGDRIVSVRPQAGGMEGSPRRSRSPRLPSSVDSSPVSMPVPWSTSRSSVAANPDRSPSPWWSSRRPCRSGCQRARSILPRRRWSDSVRRRSPGRPGGYSPRRPPNPLSASSCTAASLSAGEGRPPNRPALRSWTRLPSRRPNAGGEPPRAMGSLSLCCNRPIPIAGGARISPPSLGRSTGCGCAARSIHRGLPAPGVAPGGPSPGWRPRHSGRPSAAWLSSRARSPVRRRSPRPNRGGAAPSSSGRSLVPP